MKWEEMNLRAEDDYSVDMDITDCGICGSDIHTMDANWGVPKYPVCVVSISLIIKPLFFFSSKHTQGHEIAGVCTRVGPKVKNVKVGDRIGVGAQSGSCHRPECTPCSTGWENLCRTQFIGTYNGLWANGDKSYGGYADKWRGDCRFVFKIPDNLSNEVACTFFCAGVTTYGPLKRHNVNSDSVVGVMGIGGLGHYSILWAKAMGATVVAMSHSDKKRDVSLQLGADDYIVTSDPESLDRYKGKLSHIMCTGTGKDFKCKFTYLFFAQCRP